MNLRTKPNRHLLCWLLYTSYFFLSLLSGNKTEQAPWIMGSYVLLQAVTFYVGYLLIFPHLMRPARRRWLPLALLGAVALFIVLRYAIEQVLYPAVLGFGNYAPGTRLSYYILDNSYFALPPLGVSAAVWGFENALRQAHENEQLRQEKTQAELAFLKTQINPHFLYNTLNYLYYLALPVSDKLAGAVLRLSELMRYTLQDAPDGQVALSKELEYLRSYVELYRLRFGEAFFVCFELRGEPVGQHLAPLLLIPFVENALKHGIVNEPQRPVRICLQAGPGRLAFEVRNAVSSHQKDATSGIGLENVRRRLALLYPDRHRLEISQAGGEFRTRLELLAL